MKAGSLAAIACAVACVAAPVTRAFADDVVGADSGAGTITGSEGNREGDDSAPVMRTSHIPYGPERLAQMAAYSQRHYGESTWRLAPRAIVLHYTCGPSYVSAWYTFARNRPHNGELPGVSAHYIVDRDGTIHELVPPDVRCRHTTGMNHVAIGVEFVQRCVRGGARVAEHELLSRDGQMNAGARLVRHLQRRFGIGVDGVLGHAMANRHPFFLDRLGLTNDHGDWRRGAVREFLRRVGSPAP
jgi:hypothetical protein